MSATKCQHCGERFKAQRRTAKFCSAKCRNEAGRRRRTGTGPQVGMVIEQRAASVADRPRMAVPTGSAVRTERIWPMPLPGLS